MNAEENHLVGKGLSLGARLFLGGATLLIGALMVLIASPEEGSKQLFFYGLGTFCFLITLACVAQGRPRPFFGSAIGVGVFAASLWYLASMLGAGPVASASRAEPSMLNGVLFLAFFGVPGAHYAWRTRFGFRRAP